MNQGGEAGHDDYGLPPVDIEIPDDARELYRDVQAYHRELRALRRHQRSLRWRAPFHRSGIAIPLLAGCLVAALVAVMISAVFTSNSPYFTRQHPSSPPGAGKGGTSGERSTKANDSSIGPSASPTNGAAGPVPTASENELPGKLPGKTIDVAGKPLSLRGLVSTALAIVPENCSCGPAVLDLLTQAGTAGVIIYLVGPRGSMASLERLLAGASTSATKVTRVATDDQNVLAATYKPVGLTVLFVDAHGSVTVESGLRRPFMLADRLRMLKPTG